MRREASDSGSVWILAPAAVLVLVILGALAVDSAVVFLGQRQLSEAASSAATNAVSAISRSAFYRQGRVVIDSARATQVADETVASEDLSAARLSSPPVVIVEGDQVCVRLVALVRPIFGRAIPGMGSPVQVHAVSVATAAGYATDAVPKASIC